MTETKSQPGAPLRLLQFTAGVLIAIKLSLMLLAGPHGDEAYYWLWGQHPALSYFDHPGLHAWMQALMAGIFGWTRFGVRAAALLTSLVVVGVLFVWVRRLAGANWREHFWATLVIFLASPLFFIFSTITFNDHLLVALCLLSAHFFLSFLADWSDKHGSHASTDRTRAPAPLEPDAKRWMPAFRGQSRDNKDLEPYGDSTKSHRALAGGQEARFRDLYLGAFFLGLAGLAKYNAVFLGLALAAMILMRGDLRGLLRSVHLYAAAAVSIGLQAPTILWNLTHGLASFRFHLVERHGGNLFARFSLEPFAAFLSESLLFLSPFLAAMLAVCFLARGRTAFERAGLGLGKWAFGLSVLVIGGMSFFTQVHYYWNIVAYTLLLPFVALYAGRRVLFWGHAIYGIVLALFVTVNYAIVPVGAFWGQLERQAVMLYGWDEVAAVVAEARESHQPGFIAGGDYIYASELAFALQDPDVTELSARTDMFDIWFDAQAHAGERALVVADRFNDVGYLAGQFEGFTPIDEVTISRFGLPLATYTIYLGEGFRPYE